jgi:protoporphyrin/coproporphyrin ferrochelatase
VSATFDAVLLIAFGGPTKPDEIRPFLEHVLRGRPVPPERIEEVAHHYERIGGRSPLNDHTELQRAALQAQLAQRGAALPVHMGMWHARPFLGDVLRELAERGVRRIAGVVMASFYDRTTLERYRAVVDAALAEIALPELRVEYVRAAELHDGFIQANVEHIRAARERLPAAERAAARVLFTAHSVPSAVGVSSGYVASFENAALRCAQQLGGADYRCVYQSRSGSPREPWLEPDVCVALREEAARGTRAVLLAPIGFVCDHVEVLYDLDVEAAEVAGQLGIALARASTCSVHPAYVAALADSVLEAQAG